MKRWISCPFQTSFCVETEDEGFLTNLKLKYGRYCVEYGESDASCFGVIRDPETDLYRIRWKGEESCYYSPLGYLAREIGTCRKFHSDIFALHGAAVVHDGGAYVFLAATTSGKTTLTTFLTQNGFGYLTDDCVLIDRETLEVFPCTTPIHLREGGVSVLRQYGYCPTLAHLRDPGFERWTFTPLRCEEQPVPLKQIFFLQRTEGENSVVGLPTNEIFSRLLTSPIVEYSLTADYLKMISRLAQGVPKELRYADMNYVKEVLHRGYK
ncbi:MAG: hypothetical protein J6B54_06180 [Clostridia bacterium]|nr:hypothetical protein [Clostridia bacterium]